MKDPHLNQTPDENTRKQGTGIGFSSMNVHL